MHQGKPPKDHGKGVPISLPRPRRLVLGHPGARKSAVRNVSLDVSVPSVWWHRQCYQRDTGEQSTENVSCGSTWGPGGVRNWRPGMDDGEWEED